MSWPRGQKVLASGRFGRPLRAQILVLTLLAAPLLAGCDGASAFRPMYGSTGLGGGAAEAKMAEVEFATIPSRVGQRIRNELIFQSTGGGNPLPPKYRFDVTIRYFLPRQPIVSGAWRFPALLQPADLPAATAP